MNTRQNMIIAKEKNITSDISSCHYNEETNQFDIIFNSGKEYSYHYDNVIWIKKPNELNPLYYKIKHNNKELFGISEIYEFIKYEYNYWYICFENKTERPYEKNSLVISKSILSDIRSKRVFDYMKNAADHFSIRGDDGTKILSKQYEKIDFIGEDEVISTYFNPERYSIKTYPSEKLIFPFGCNASQYKAVNNALCNQLSIIQGPPGTGKTQTILNIIANLLLANKSIQVVSNNNSAIANVLEKLSSPEYNLGFLVAMLGNNDNKVQFIENQDIQYPSIIQTWDSSILKDSYFLNVLNKKYEELNQTYIKQEKLALAKQNLQELEIEFKHFEQYTNETDRTIPNIKIRKKLKAEQYLLIWKDFQRYLEIGKKLSFLLKLKCRFKYGIADWGFYKKETDIIVTLLQWQFYKTKQYEILREIENLKNQLSNFNKNKLVEELSKISMAYLRAVLKERYKENTCRKVFCKDDFWKSPEEIQKEYPVILSTTFSARSSLNKNAKFDYIIIDEASQVDVVTGSLALSCAKNAVVVGDEKQLPNVVTRKNKDKLQAIFKEYDINKNYNFAEKSFLQSINCVIPKVPQILLREHYRCHPKIINFCNQRFYGGELLIMTEDKGEEDTISVNKTVIGNHERDHLNQRQIDVLINEVLPNITSEKDKIGIIAPYRNQVEAINKELAGKRIDIATVHKFQGREKDCIIITTVDNKITEFSDDPFLLNVAISRAKKRLCIIVSGNEQPKNSNIRDLIDYIDYYNVVKESKVYSIFDFLYLHYEENRIGYLKKYKRVSEYDSENLMYALIKDVLHEKNYHTLNIVCHMPLNMLIRDTTILNDKERRYAMNNCTHIDFLIYNHLSKKTVLAIEVDGYHFHKKGTVQSERDIKKDHILELYGIPLLRFATNGSGEKEALIAKLKEVTKSD